MMWVEEVGDAIGAILKVIKRLQLDVEVVGERSLMLCVCSGFGASIREEGLQAMRMCASKCCIVGSATSTFTWSKTQKQLGPCPGYASSTPTSHGRNAICHGTVSCGTPDPQSTVTRIHHFVAEMVDELGVDPREAKDHRDGVDSISWSPLPRGWLKINCDGAASLSGHAASCGFLVKTHTSRTVCSISVPLQGGSALTAEAIAIKESLRVAKQRRWTHFILEGDSKSLIAILEGKEVQMHWEASTILEDIKKLWSEFPFARASFIRRNGNREAHNLARAALRLTPRKSWHPIEVRDI
ncbi:hypothetical protein HHK36_009134 [Tetracentron sinense]|uniref:RNase H type-1 domain-containing protein n=1 Tax=Tetracentron sinense TaxID=13715 RepID=A0A835DKR9_TETSI|nr:hypothetical protein HHK36_009134 [Tetracentron sinense]